MGVVASLVSKYRYTRLKTSESKQNDEEKPIQEENELTKKL